MFKIEKNTIFIGKFKILIKEKYSSFNLVNSSVADSSSKDNSNVLCYGMEEVLLNQGIKYFVLPIHGNLPLYNMVTMDDCETMVYFIGDTLQEAFEWIENNKEW